MVVNNNKVRGNLQRFGLTFLTIFQILRLPSDCEERIPSLPIIISRLFTVGTNIERHFQNSLIIHIFLNRDSLNDATLPHKCKALEIQTHKWLERRVIQKVFERQTETTQNISLRLYVQNFIHLFAAQSKNPVCPRHELDSGSHFLSTECQ